MAAACPMPCKSRSNRRTAARRQPEQLSSPGRAVERSERRTVNKIRRSTPYNVTSNRKERQMRRMFGFGVAVTLIAVMVGTGFRLVAGQEATPTTASGEGVVRTEL